jgi:hypothetical protein
MKQAGRQASKSMTPDGRIYALPRRHRPGAAVPLTLIQNQTCLICGAYGCVPRLVTPEHEGGTLTGDNVIPLCKGHASYSLAFLWNSHFVIRQWLREHERFDIVLALNPRV